MMSRTVLLILAVSGACSTNTFADEYVLRLDVVGYVDAPADEEQPKEALLRSIEAVARPQAKLYSKAALNAKETMLLTGEISSRDSDTFKVRFEYVYSRDTGATIPTEGGGRRPEPEVESVQSMVTLAVGKPVAVGVIESVKSSRTEARTKSRHRLVLLLTLFESDD